MPNPDAEKSCISEYLEAVGGQIRWKRARKPILAELEAHILDRRDALISGGNCAEEAERRAVGEMGDPADTGAMLDRVHRPRPDWPLIGCFAALSAFGTALLGILGDPADLRYMLICAGIGIAALIAGYFLDYTLLAKYPKTVFFGTLSASLLLEFLQPRLFIVVSTSARELLYALPLAFSAYVYSKRTAFGGSGKTPVKTIAAVYVAGALCLIATMYSGDGLGILFYVSVCCVGVFIFAVRKGIFSMSRKAAALHCALPAALAICFALAVLTFAYSQAKERLNGIFHPYSYSDAYGYLSVLMREYTGGARFIGEGGTTGKADGLIFPSPDRLPFFTREYMLAVAAHKLGWIVIAAVVLLLFAIAFFILRGIRRQTSLIGRMTAFAVSLSFGIRAAAYLASNLGFELIVLDGLPLFSYCGKLAVIDMFMAGLLLSVFRTESITRDSGVLYKGRTSDPE